MLTGLQKIFLPIVTVAALSGCGKQSEDLLVRKQELIINLLNNNARLTDSLEGTEECMVTIMGSTGKQIKIIVACDGRLLLEYQVHEISKSEFVTQIHRMDVKNKTLQNRHDTCITIEDNRGSVTNCKEDTSPELPEKNTKTNRLMV